MRESVSVLANAGFHQDVQRALNDWSAETAQGPHNPGVLIGGVALAFYTKPRYTQDVDILYLTDEDVPKQVRGFNRHRKGAFEHRSTGVEVEVVTSHAFGQGALPLDVARQVVNTAKDIADSTEFKVASREGLIAMKLWSAKASPRRSFKDLADVVALLEKDPNLNMKPWAEVLSDKHIQDSLKQCRELAASTN